MALPVTDMKKIFFLLLAFPYAALIHLILKLYKARSSFYKKAVKPGLPMPKWNPIFGHLLVLNNVFKTKRLPPDVHRPGIFGPLAADFENSDSLFYMDLWPFINPLMVVSSPKQAVQICQNHNLAKPDDLVSFLHPIAGGNSVFTANGEAWKRARSIFSVGFNTNYVLNQTAHIVEEAKEYVKILHQYAEKGTICLMDKVTLNYTTDISGAMTLNTRLRCQREPHPFAEALRRTLKWNYQSEASNPIFRFIPILWLVTWYNGRKMDAFIAGILDQRYSKWKRSDSEVFKAKRSGVDLALVDYITSHEGQLPEKLDPGFKSWATTQLRMLFFTGLDSTSPTICYTHYLLSKNASALAKIRQEHDQVFGQDLSLLPKLLSEQPHLLNQLPYTTAVIKETLRLFPPASGFRSGAPGVYLDGEDGTRYPTEGMRVWILHSTIQRNPKYWKDPDAFLPERWLVSPDDPLYPVKGSWRPFEHGKRDCFGQALSLLDLKITIAMTVRTFNIKDAYEEWDAIHPKATPCVYNGERAYQMGHGGGHPADWFPCRISLQK